MRRLFALVLLTTVPLVSSTAASAHPTDILVQTMYVTPTDDAVAVDLELTPGSLVAQAFLAGVDSDGDGTISPAEAAAHTAVVERAVTVTVDGAAVPYTVDRTDYPDAKLLLAGGGTIVLGLVARVPSGPHEVSVTDTYAPVSTQVEGVVTPQAASLVAVASIQHLDEGRTMTFAAAPTSAVAPARATASLAVHEGRQGTAVAGAVALAGCGALVAGGRAAAVARRRRSPAR